MREFTKSALSFSWALSLLGMKQTFNLLNWGNQSQVQRDGRLFDSVTETAVEQLDDSMKGIFRSVDNVQNRVVDMVFASFNPANWNAMNWFGNCGRAMSESSSRPQDSGEQPPYAAEPASSNRSTFGSASGWGPMPGDGSP
jgi:hypothetical protein